MVSAPSAVVHHTAVDLLHATMEATMAAATVATARAATHHWVATADAHPTTTTMVASEAVMEDTLATATATLGALLMADVVTTVELPGAAMVDTAVATGEAAVTGEAAATGVAAATMEAAGVAKVVATTIAITTTTATTTTTAATTVVTTAATTMVAPLADHASIFI